MTAFCRWATIVIFMTLIGGFLGGCLGQILRNISSDYVYEVPAYAFQGFRAGLALGSFIGMMNCFRKQTSLLIRNLLIVGSLIWCATIALTILSGTVMYLISSSGVSIHFMEKWEVGNPNRTAACCGLQFGWVCGMIVFGFIAGTYIRICLRESKLRNVD